MKINRRNLKAIVLSLGLGVAMLSSNPAQAQLINLLDEYYDEMDAKNSPSSGSLLRGAGDSGTVSGEGLTVNTQDFGQVPLGSGIAILIGAGLGYVALKKKEDEQ